MTGSSPERATNRYSSPLRAERAADTRERIVTAARRLFAERGFRATTVAQIAEKAGIAQSTVYATFANKSEIVQALLFRLETEAGADEWRAQIDTEPDARRKLEKYAAWHRQLFSGGQDVLAAALDARGDPGAVELFATGIRSAHEWLNPIVAALASAEALAPGLSQRQARERVLMLTGSELYFRARDVCGWSDDHYERWLAEALQAQVLGVVLTLRAGGPVDRPGARGAASPASGRAAPRTLRHEEHTR